MSVYFSIIMIVMAYLSDKGRLIVVSVFEVEISHCFILYDFRGDFEVWVDAYAPSVMEVEKYTFSMIPQLKQYQRDTEISDG